jgi:signal transduction histidine kinase
VFRRQVRRGAPRPPARFRRRLTAAFVLAAAVGAGVMAVLAIVVADEYRWRTYEDRSVNEARLVLALAPRELDEDNFERLRGQYELRSESELVVSGAAGEFSTSPVLGVDAVPAELRDPPPPDGRLDPVEVTVDGRHYLVVGARASTGDRYWLFASVEELRASLGQLTRASAAAFVVTVLLAGVAGRLLARRTLRPVAAAAEVAEAITGGQRDARLPEGADEFGAWAASFNRMADTVQETIGQLERSADRERRFTADVAHELRTPLTGMAASAGILAELLPGLPAEARRPASVLVTDVRRLRILVLELLELSRLDAAADAFRPEPLDVEEAVAASRRGLGDAAPGALTVQVPPGCRVLAEPPRLDRILGNLLANAATHGGGVVDVQAVRDGADVVIEVCDDGPGVPDDELPRVFDRFAKSDRARASGGSGLGLAIARAQARAQGGDITVRNGDGGGACFAVRLPAAP